jgi:hypothetical protein
MPPAVRRAFATLDDGVKAAVPGTLVTHRELMYGRHLVLPVRCADAQRLREQKFPSRIRNQSPLLYS